MFFPIKDDNPTVRTPVVTIALIAINTGIFLLMWLSGSELFYQLTLQFGFTPDLFLDINSRYPDLSTTWMTPWTSMFMHGGWMHLIGNMLFLWIYGNNIEDYFGPVKFLLFYLISGIAAVAAYTLVNVESQVPLVGASGAIAGVMGAYMVLHPRARITVLVFLFFMVQFIELPAKVLLGFWIVYQIVMSFLDQSNGGGVAWLAHIGGFAFGYVVLWLLLRARGGGPTRPAGAYRMQWN